jgi:hypothetical protein
MFACATDNSTLVPRAGLEPARPFEQMLLRHQCLPYSTIPAYFRIQVLCPARFALHDDQNLTMNLIITEEPARSNCFAAESWEGGSALRLQLFDTLRS